jgi:hypothetical protein
VFPETNLLMTRGWTTDIELDANNHPYAVFTARVNDNSSDHRFFYARHTAAGWNVNELAKAGGGLYSPENDYTGLVALDPNNPNRLFMSSNIDPRTQESMSRYEIFEGMTNNGGESWAWQPITYYSTVDNLRPIVPKWDGQNTALLWMRGTYTTYEIYDLDIVGLTEFEPIDGSGPGTKPPVHIPVAGPWTNAVSFGSGPISNANTSSPTVGDGTFDSAAQEMIDSPFPEVTLENTGDKIIFTGSVTLTGTINSPASQGNPRTQFRFGLFDGDSDDLGWVGYYMSNRHGNCCSTPGVLALKPEGNTSTYLQAAGHNILASEAGDGTTASLFHDGTYSMTLEIERSGDDLVITGELEGSNGFMQSLSATNATASTLGTYTFDRLGFLLGDNLDADQAAFSNLLVTYIEAFAPGDFNGDDVVDAADYVSWKKTNNTQTKYNEWRMNFGNSGGAGSSVDLLTRVPEPAVWALLTVAALCISWNQRSRW